MSSNVEIIKKHLLNNVKDLIVNLGVSHNEIIKDIHDAVIKLGVSLPKIQVLYNSVYGGYGLSEAFLAYVSINDPRLHKEAINQYSKQYRTEAVKHIVPFGLEILEKHPLLKDILIIYHKFKFNTIFNNLSSIYYNEKKLQSLQKRRNEIEKILCTPAYHGTKTAFNNLIDNDVNDDDVNDDKYDNTKLTIYDIVNYNYIQLHGYSKETYEKAIEMIDKDIDVTTQYNDSYKSKCIECNITQEVFENMKRVFFELQRCDNTSRHLDYSFVDSINKYGIYDHKVWKQQSRYNSTAIQYLIKKSQEYIPQNAGQHNVYDFAVSHKYINITEEDYNDIVKEFALECASSRYCSLKIGEVPQFISWHIGEYDGKESIVLN